MLSVVEVMASPLPALEQAPAQLHLRAVDRAGPATAPSASQPSMRSRVAGAGLGGAQPEPLSRARAGGSAGLGGVRGSACRPRRTDALAGVGDQGPPPLVTTAPLQEGSR